MRKKNKKHAVVTFDFMNFTDFRLVTDTVYTPVEV